MKIYSMTATFGKLAGQTMTLKPGLNVIQAPNEWGKSTWCAFLTAMFYGLDTRSHSTKTALSDKDRHSPWSGAPMSGRIDLNWKGRDITIERKTKGRTLFGDFRAYETASGLPVPELTAQNCGQLLLGVEKSVFTRSAMIRLTDLPVTQDEALRRRLNALVTTGDDSGTAENLERRLRELKNRCRYNRTGLLPQAEAELAELDRKLQELKMLESQSRKLCQRCTELEGTRSDLENHRTALRYAAAQDNARRRCHGEAVLREAEATFRAMEIKCAALPAEEQAHQTRTDLMNLQQRWAQLRLETEKPKQPSSHPLFRGITPEDALSTATADASRYTKLRKLPLLWLIFPFLVFFAGIAVMLLAPEYVVPGYWAIGAGILGAVIWAVIAAVRHHQAKAIAACYGNADPAKWIRDAEDYVNHTCHTDSLYQKSISDLRQQTEALCRGQSLANTLAYWQDICANWDALHTARKEWELAKERFAILDSRPVDAPAPERPDSLTLTDVQTRNMLDSTGKELQELQLRLGHCQGQMEAIGHRTTLETRRDQVSLRIRRLEDTYEALELALSTLERARNTLQRRFAPRITARAQDILQRLTDGRYDRLVLGEDLTLQTNSRDEEALRTTLWRSDGTTDLLYLALRLAVAGELTPEAPLVLDDALVRFDDRRLARAMDVLKEEAVQRQIILFTCHSRETQYI